MVEFDMKGAASIRQLAALISISTAFAATPKSISIQPGNPLLFGQGATQALVVIAQYPDGSEKEITNQSQFSAANPAIASVDSTGKITAHSSGAAAIHVTYEGISGATTTLVQRAEAPIPQSFNADIMPILTKMGCNGGSCHGALNGKNGFKLSLFGYEPDKDYDMIVHKHEGRRINLADPEQSLILLKPTFQVSHGGGKLLRKDSPDYNSLLTWIHNGARLDPELERHIVSIRVLPPASVLTGKSATRQMLVVARYSDGTERDVTRTVKFQSNDDSIASVSPEGVVTGERGGETAIVVRAPGIAAAAKVGVVIVQHQVPEFAANNFIDDAVFAKLKALQIPPAPLADDATFLRRASLDIIGLIPTSDEARAFLADKDPGKRSKLVDALLKRPEYADFWALYWGDHLGNTKQLLYNKGPYVFTRWLHDAFAKNLPYDQFARELLTSSGDMYQAGATNYYPLMR